MFLVVKVAPESPQNLGNGRNGGVRVSVHPGLCPAPHPRTRMIFRVVAQRDRSRCC